MIRDIFLILVAAACFATGVTTLLDLQPVGFLWLAAAVYLIPKGRA